MKNRLVVAVAALLAALGGSMPVGARLGETNVEIAKRYGAVEKRVEKGTNSWAGFYSFKEYNIMVIYETNRSVAEIVRPIEDRHLSETEVESLMKSIGGDGFWAKESASGGLKLFWKNTTTKAQAFLERKILGSDTLMVMSPAFVRRFEAEAEQGEKAKVEGF